MYWIAGEVPRVVHRAAPADTLSWSEPSNVSQPLEIAVRPSIAVHDGRLIVAYESHLSGFGTTPRQVVVAERDDSAWLSTVVAGSSYAGVIAPQVHRAPGRVWVDWTDGDTTMRWSMRRDGEGWTPLESEPFSGNADLELHVRNRIRAAVRTQE